MKIIEPGHVYELENVDGTEPNQTIHFLKKTFTTDEDGVRHQNVADGVNTEEVILMLLDRTSYINEHYPSNENAFVIDNLKAALTWLAKRPPSA